MYSETIQVLKRFIILKLFEPKTKKEIAQKSHQAPVNITDQKSRLSKFNSPSKYYDTPYNPVLIYICS